MIKVIVLINSEFYFCVMKIIKNSCNGRGCSVRIILPNDGIAIIVHSKMYGARNDFSKVLSKTNISLDTLVEKEGSLEKVFS